MIYVLDIFLSSRDLGSVLLLLRLRPASNIYVCVSIFFSKLMLLFKINNPESLYASVHFTFTNGRGYKRLFHIKRLRNTCFNV